MHTLYGIIIHPVGLERHYTSQQGKVISKDSVPDESFTGCIHDLQLSLLVPFHLVLKQTCMLSRV